jgi:ubiquinone/menaquinone biosynthesis C-methylase UbiE
MSNLGFRLMSLTFDLVDLVRPYIDRRVTTFGIREGMTVVDYGCGPGRYTTRFAKLVGDRGNPVGIAKNGLCRRGKVYAVDIHELAIQAVKAKSAKLGLQNVVPVLAHGYDSTLPNHVADVVCALDMFFGIKQPAEFLAELKRITKPDGVLVIDDGHQPRQMTKDKILASGLWVIQAETPDHLTCRPA